MFNSLKSRFWLTYTVLIVILLVAVGIGVLLALRNNPQLYRQPLTELEMVARSTTILLSENHDPVKMKYVLNNESSKTNTRLILFRADGSLIFDSDPLPGARLAISTPFKSSSPGEVRFITDNRGRDWVYTVVSVDNQSYLLAATRQPRLPLILLLRDELYTPMVRAGLLGMLLSIALAMILGNWVEAPLIKLSRQVSAVTRGDAQPISLEGPAEVRQLIGSFNEMVTRLNASQQSQRDFIANVSHELKTPLTSIQGFSQAILDQTTTTPDETRQSARIILDEAQRMNKLVMGLLTLARLDAGMNEASSESVDLAVILRTVMERLTPQAQSFGITLVDEIEPVPEILADGENIKQVFVNLVDNDIKYSFNGGKVILKCRQQGPEVEVHIIDTGMGISKQDLARIFERFYQIDKSRRGGEKRGVGLGLAITGQLIHSMGGSVTVQSEPGAGSDFMVKLPIE
jgi:two-component system OmpR family sensor kinase